MTPPVSGTSGTGRQEALPDIRVFVSPLDPLLAVTKLLDVVVMVTNVLEDKTGWLFYLGSHSAAIKRNQ